ncbi:MAG: YqjK-like family protein [Hydrogenophaga sp.]|uniref:YqjK-like family protein n=1 Tax=Hydrogenophaga sp. TaxID=1904254 RepID=UPI0025C1A886|nr:YqjK-like family protein [Hydrogenophaga sp.]MBU7573452.1 YqjK-like family protein [Hydrogenophaga sp.]
MNPRAVVLAMRRERLVLRSQQLRRQITTELQAVQPALTWVDRLQDALLWLRGNPLIATAGSLLLAVWRPRRAAGFGMRLWSAWKFVQGLRGVGAKSPSPWR